MAHGAEGGGEHGGVEEEASTGDRFACTMVEVSGVISR